MSDLPDFNIFSQRMAIFIVILIYFLPKVTNFVERILSQLPQESESGNKKS